MTTFTMYNRTTLEVIERQSNCLDLFTAEVLISAYEYGCEDELEFFFVDEDGTRYHYEWVADAKDWLGEWGDFNWVKVS